MFTVTDLTKRYGSRTAVDRLTFTVPDSTVTGFLGPNGSGKSTTMRCMLGLDRPTSGQVRVDGVPFATLDDKAGVAGAVLEATWFDPKRSGRGHLQVLAAGAGLPADRVDEALAIVGLQSAADKKVRGYSLGMKQRLGLAAALLGRPRHLILDEPVNGLDPEGVSWVRHTIRRLASEGCAVLVSSHLLSEMEQTADRLVVIGRGRLIGEYSMAEFLAGGSTVVVDTDDNDAASAELAAAGLSATAAADGLQVPVPAESDEAAVRAAVSAACMRSGRQILSLYTRSQNLEQRFLDATGEDQEYRAAMEGALR